MACDEEYLDLCKGNAKEFIVKKKIFSVDGKTLFLQMAFDSKAANGPGASNVVYLQKLPSYVRDDLITQDPVIIPDSEATEGMVLPVE